MIFCFNRKSVKDVVFHVFFFLGSLALVLVLDVLVVVLAVLDAHLVL